jgi:hypothetical protein
VVEAKHPDKNTTAPMTSQRIKPSFVGPAN